MNYAERNVWMDASWMRTRFNLALEDNFPLYSSCFCLWNSSDGLKLNSNTQNMTQTKRLKKMEKVLKKELRKVHILKQVFGSGSYIPLYQCTTRWKVKERWFFPIMASLQCYLIVSDRLMLYDLLQMRNTCGVACVATICQGWRFSGKMQDIIFHSAGYIFYSACNFWIVFFSKNKLFFFLMIAPLSLWSFSS